jgi:hypothetical protein
VFLDLLGDDVLLDALGLEDVGDVVQGISSSKRS